MPLTGSTPKPMLLVGAKPILEHILTSAISQGFENFVISVNYLGNQIESYFGDGSAWGVSITYLREEEPLGTAGALSLLPRSVPGPIVVSNGDLVTNLDYRAMIQNHEQAGAIISMAIRRFELRNPYGVVATNGEFVEAVAFKFDPTGVPDLPLPHPAREIWVYSTQVEGVHLRFGDVARGGVRWSAALARRLAFLPHLCHTNQHPTHTFAHF
jgi:NDP-sugar pyrophosphorylase family protein